MGPPTLVDGDLAREVLDRIAADRLQWGRRLSSTETTPPSTAQAPGRCFNGAADSRRRRHLPVRRARALALCFNGAADSRRRRPLRAKLDAAAAGKLQWGRRLSSTETSV